MEQVFQAMAEAGYATSTIDHTWTYLNQTCLYALRRGVIKTNPAADVLLPAAQAPRKRKSLTIEKADKLLRVGIPQDARPALWMTGLVCGLRPGELAGLRWPYVDIDGKRPCLDVAECVNEVGHRYVGQATPKTARKGAIGLHRWWLARCVGIAAT